MATRHILDSITLTTEQAVALAIAPIRCRDCFTTVPFGWLGQPTLSACLGAENPRGFGHRAAEHHVNAVKDRIYNERTGALL